MGLINEKSFPVMYHVIDKAMKCQTWDYKCSDDFLTYGLDDDVGFALNREIEGAPANVVDLFFLLMPWDK